MAKQSKRVRKFQASGGVAARLKKGTITKRGKVKARSSSKTVAEQQQQHPVPLGRVKQKRSHNDDDMVTGTKNLANLDLDAFFAQVADTLEPDMEDENDLPTREQQQDQEASESFTQSDNDDDDDDDDDHGDSSSSGQEPNEKASKQKRTASASSSQDEDSHDDDEEEDIEAAEARMKKEMARLKESDPDFVKFLQENEQDLLEFGKDDNESDDQDDDEHDNDIDMKQAKEEATSSKANNETTLTMALLDKLRRGTFDAHGTKALKKLVAAYRSGCHLADAADSPKESRSQSYNIESPRVFDNLMVLCLSRCHESFTFHLLAKKKDDEDDNKGENTKGQDQVDSDNQPIPPHKLENSDKWDIIKPSLLSFLRSTVHLLNESKEPGLLGFVLKSLAKFLLLMTPFPRIAEALLKTCISLWSAPQQDTSENFSIVRLQAFFRIRQLALTQPYPFIETCLKKTYMAYLQRATFGTSSSLVTTLPTLTFMGNCLVELYSLDCHSSYQHAFVYIRQLALYLRAALQKKTPEALKQVYGWQYMHCLKLWVAVLAQAAAKQDEEPDAKLMGSLLYPLAEIISGTARIAPSPVRLLPLRLQCIRLLQLLAASAQVYLPTTSLLLDCFDWKEWYAKPKKATKRNTLRGGLPLYMLLKLPKEDPLRTHEQLEAGLVQLFVLLEREMELYRYTAAFAEFRVRIRQRCRDFSKTVKPPRWKAYAKACIEKADQYASFCILERAKLTQSPKDIAQLECLRPSHVPTMRERHQNAMDQESKTAQSSLAAAAAESVAQKPTSFDDERDEEEAQDDDDDMNDGQDTEKTGAKKSKRKRSKKKRKTISAADNNDEVMEQEDELVEGADWLEE